MFTQNLHAHSTWDDGKSSLEEMLLASKAAGLMSIGFSVHAPMIFGSSWTCPKSNLNAYIAEVRRLQEKYAGEIDVFLGAEWDVFSDIDLSLFDYAIGSVHHVPQKMRLPEDCQPELAAQFGMDYPSVDESAEATARCLKSYYGGDSDTMAVDYFREVEKVADQPLAPIVGHFDLITKFDEARGFFHPESAVYQKAALAAMEKLVRAGKIFEVNTGAISRGYRSEPYPSRELLDALREMGGRVTISADAHHVSSVTCAFDLAETIIREAGFKDIWKLVRIEGKAVFVPEAW